MAEIIVCRSAVIVVSCFAVKERASVGIQPLPAEVKIALAGMIFAAGLTYVLAVSLRRRYKFRGWNSWPVAEATVETMSACIVALILSASGTPMRSTVPIRRRGKRECFLLARPKRKHTLPVFGAKRSSFDSILRIQNVPVSTKHRLRHRCCEIPISNTQNRR